jgi:type I restriction enzyme R subunit
VVIDRGTIETIKAADDGKATKVINLIKAIQKEAEDKSEDPFLLAMADRAKAVQESFESRHDSTEEALENLLSAIAKNEERQREQAAKGLDSLTYFMMLKFTDEGIPNAEKVANRVQEAFRQCPHWRTSEAEMREARKRVTFAIFAVEEDLNKVTAIVDTLFTLLRRSLHS